jgi:Domain of unknown function (DUF4359)
MSGWGLIILVIGLIFTNPAPAAYEDYLVAQIRVRAQQECQKASENAIGALVANVTCQNLMSAGLPYLQNLLQPVLADHTTRYNWGIASLYITQLDITALNFAGQIETIGILDRFFTYKIP